MSSLKKALVAFTLATGCSFVPGLSVAQTIPLDPIKIRITPETPGPHTPVRIELQDATATLKDATIVWSLNGKTASSGTAQRSFSFTTGALGETIRVAVHIESGSGPIDREFVFRPSAVRLVWEADTYVPPFYKGKAELSPGANLRMHAFTDIRDAAGARIPASNLIFSWERGGTKFADRSGLGVTTFSVQGSQLTAGEEIAVSVSTRAGERVGYASLFIPSTDPYVRVYERHPLQGIIYARALQQKTSFSEQEVTLVAEPYFFSAASRSGNDLYYEWRLNGELIPSAALSGTLTIQSTKKGEAVVALSVQNIMTTRLLQVAEALFGITIGQETNSIF